MTHPLPLPARIASDPERAKRLAAYTANRRYYSGDHDIARVRAGRSPRPLARNYIGLVVDTLAAHMGTPTISWPAEDGSLEALDAFVADTIAAAGGDQLLYDAELACSIDGDAALKVTWDDRGRRVRVTNVDAATLWIETRPDDPRAIETIAQQYPLAPTDAPIMFPGRVVTLARTVLLTEEWTVGRWRIWMDETLIDDQPNPYGDIPYVVYPNIRAPSAIWGDGDPARLRPAQDRLNEAGWDKDRLMTIAGSIVVLQGVDGDGDIRVAPGAIWELPDAASATVLDLLQGNALSAHHEHMAELRSVLHDLARVPEAALGDRTGSAVQSGAALAIRLQPLVRLVARKRLSRSAALQSLAGLIVSLGARYGALPAPPPATAPRVTWTDAIPSDRADDLAAAEAELRLGRSRAAVLQSIGVDDPAAELAARATENQRLGATHDRPAAATSLPAPAG